MTRLLHQLMKRFCAFLKLRCDSTNIHDNAHHVNVLQSRVDVVSITGHVQSLCALAVVQLFKRKDAARRLCNGVVDTVNNTLSFQSITEAWMTLWLQFELRIDQYVRLGDRWGLSIGPTIDATEV